MIPLALCVGAGIALPAPAFPFLSIPSEVLPVSPCSPQLRFAELGIDASEPLLAPESELRLEEPLDAPRLTKTSRGLGSESVSAGSHGEEQIARTRRRSPLAARQSSRQRQDPAAQGKGAYAHLSCTDVDDPASFWWTDRENMVGEPVDPEWDPLKLINTDRPDFTDVAPVVGDGVVQIETGYLNWRRSDDEVRRVTESIPNVLVRVGSGDRFEYRVKWRGYAHNDLRDLSSGIQAVEEGASDMEIGCKWVVAEQDDLFPMQTLVTRLGLPVGSSEISSDRVEPGASYIFNWQARRWWFFRANTGVDFFHQPAYSFVRVGGVPVQPAQVQLDHDRWIEISQSFSSYMQVSKRLGMFVEWFSFSRHGSSDDHIDHYHNYGLYYYLTPDMQLEVRAGWRLGNHVDESFTAAGFSMRF